jgi:ketosteroid isomerase-like protein
MRQFMADAAENWKTSSIDVAEFREVGDKVLVLGRQKSVGALADVPVENDFGEIIGFQGDLIAEIRMFRDHDEALEAANA